MNGRKKRDQDLIIYICVFFRRGRRYGLPCNLWGGGEEISFFLNDNDDGMDFTMLPKPCL